MNAQVGIDLPPLPEINSDSVCSVASMPASWVRKLECEEALVEKLYKIAVAMRSLEHLKIWVTETHVNETWEEYCQGNWQVIFVSVRGAGVEHFAENHYIYYQNYLVWQKLCIGRCPVKLRPFRRKVQLRIATDPSLYAGRVPSFNSHQQYSICNRPVTDPNWCSSFYRHRGRETIEKTTIDNKLQACKVEVGFCDYNAHRLF